MTSVTSLEMYVDHTIKTFISTMGEKFADKNESVEIVRWIQFFTVSHYVNSGWELHTDLNISSTY